MSKLDSFSVARGHRHRWRAIGVLAPLLQRWGNPPNMGICVAAQARHRGTLGLHRAAMVRAPRSWGSSSSDDRRPHLS